MARDEITVDQAKKVTRGFSYIIVGQLVLVIAGAMCSILLARFLGPAAFGILAIIAFYLPGLIGVFGDWGIYNATVRYVSLDIASGRFGHARRIVETEWKTKVGLGFALSALCLLSSSFISRYVLKVPEVTNLVPIAAIFVLLTAMTSASTAALQGLQKLDKMAAVTIMEVLVRAVVAPLLVYIGLGIIGGLIGLVFALIVSLCLAMLFFRRIFRETFYGVRPEGSGFNALHELLSFGIPYAIGDIFLLSSLNLCPFILATLASAADVGYYRAAFSVVGVFGIFPSALQTALFPAVSGLDALHGKDTLRQFYVMTIKYACFLMIPCAFGTALLAQPLILTFFTGSYLAATPILAVFAARIALFGLGAPTSSILLGSGKPRKQATVEALTAALNISLSLALIPLFNALGAAIALVTASTVGIIVSYYFIRNYLGIWPDFKPLLRITIAATLMSLSFFPIVILSINVLLKLFVSIVVGAVAYLFFTLAVGAVDSHDVRNIDNLIKISVLHRFLKPLLGLALAFTLWFEKKVKAKPQVKTSLKNT